MSSHLWGEREQCSSSGDPPTGTPAITFYQFDLQISSHWPAMYCPRPSCLVTGEVSGQGGSGSLHESISCFLQVTPPTLLTLKYQSGSLVKDLSKSDFMQELQLIISILVILVSTTGPPTTSSPASVRESCCGLIRIVQIPITLVTAPWRSGGPIFTKFMWLREALVSKLTNLIDLVLPSRASLAHFHIKLYRKTSIVKLLLQH